MPVMASTNPTTTPTSAQATNINSFFIMIRLVYYPAKLLFSRNTYNHNHEYYINITAPH